MDIILLVLMVILIVLILFLIFKVSQNKHNDTVITERLAKFETNMVKEIGDFKYDFSNSLKEDFNLLNDRVERRLFDINEKVNERIDENFEKTNKTFSNVLERLSKIDEAQKKIDSLSSEIVSLQSVLTDKKTRGIFGEVNLNYILANVFGENNKQVYELQKHLSNGFIADAVIYAPKPLGMMCIDSKFPLENYERMIDKSLSKEEREYRTKLFKTDVKKHIEAIHSKYIIAGETASQAILFLPAEAIFAELNAYHPDLLKEAYQKRVWITSPTTLMSTLTTIAMIIKNMERDKYAKIIQMELNKLAVEFSRYKERWDKLSRSIDTVSKDVKDIHSTTEKITKRFDSINKVDLEALKTDEK
ncbi:DNA recombination protein RmuC [bacterium]|nr:DNA recombination protein RmuC [bacterium]